MLETKPERLNAPQLLAKQARRQIRYIMYRRLTDHEKRLLQRYKRHASASRNERELTAALTRWMVAARKSRMAGLAAQRAIQKMLRSVA